MRLHSTARVAILAICSGIVVYGAVYYWVNTRTWVPLDVPVSLAPGHIRTGDFKINLDATFSIQLQFPYGSGSDYTSLDRVETRQIISVGGQAVSALSWETMNNGITMGPYLGYFHGKTGQCNIDIKVLSATQDLNQSHPHLVIEASPYDYYKWGNILLNCFFFCLFCEFLGLSMLLVFFASHFRSHSFDELRLRIPSSDAPACAPPPTNLKPTWSIPFSRSLPGEKLAWGITGLHFRPPLTRRGWSVNPARNIPTISLACVLTLFVIFVPVMTLDMCTRWTSHGLLVSLPRKGVRLTANTWGLTAPLVTIDAKGRIYLDYKQTTWEKLPSGLDQSLRGLPMRVVYVDGDSKIEFHVAARVIDIIQGQGAKAILLTPDSKTEH